METFSFIGSDKNAGKTTALNHVCRELSRDTKNQQLCISSIGINGEDVDNYEGIKKPSIRLIQDQFFITACEHLDRHTGKYQTIEIFSEPDFRKRYILGNCLIPFDCVIEGPNTGNELLKLKSRLTTLLPQDAIFLLDGSVDRQFIARPDISDGFYFSILFSKRQQQKTKAEGFLKSINLPPCSDGIKEMITREKRDETKSMLFEKTEVVYHGAEIPFNDEILYKKLTERQGKKLSLYINGALTESLYSFLSPFQSLVVVLDNFTQYLNITTQVNQHKKFSPLLSLLHPVQVKKIFVKQETEFDRELLPKNIEVINLFRSVSDATET